jgi:hypothetical protein
VGRRRRSRLVAVVGASLLLVLCTACQSWAQYMGNPALNGNDAGETILGTANVARLHQVETFPAGGTFQASNPAQFSAVVSGSTLYTGSMDGRLVADSIDGTTNCSGAPKVCQPLWTASIPGMDSTGSPLVSANVVYETFYQISGSSGELAAFDANGTTNCSGSPKVCQPLWTADVYSPIGVNVDGGRLFVNTLTTAPSPALEAFDANGTTNCSGTPKVCQPLWTAPLHSFGVPSIADGRVYVAQWQSTPGAVADAYDEAGSTNCSGTPVICQPLFTVGLPAGASGSVDVSGGIGYVETLGSTVPYVEQLLAFDATGVAGCSGSPAVCQPLWTATLPGPAWFATPAVAGGRVYVTDGIGDQPAVLDVFDAAGVAGCSGTPVVCQPLMTTTPLGSGNQLGSPTVSNGLVFAHGAAFDANGVQGCTGSAPAVCSPLWSTSTPSSATTPAISIGTLFLGGDDGAIHAYQLAP